MIWIRISLGVAIAASIAVIVLGNVQLRTHINSIIDQRNKEEAAKKKALKDLSDTRNELRDTQEKLDTEQKTHADTRTKLTQTANRLQEAERNLAQTRNTLQETQAQLTKTSQELSAWQALGIPVTQVRGIIEQNERLTLEIAAARQENKLLDYKRKDLQRQLAKFIGQDEFVVELPEGLKGKVLVVDPKHDFVILNIGSKDGVLQDGVLLVNRQGRLVAKVRVAGVSADQSVANVMTGWKLTEIMEGDEVFY